MYIWSIFQEYLGNKKSELPFSFIFVLLLFSFVYSWKNLILYWSSEALGKPTFLVCDHSKSLKKIKGEAMAYGFNSVRHELNFYIEQLSYFVYINKYDEIESKMNMEHVSLISQKEQQIRGNAPDDLWPRQK